MPIVSEEDFINRIKNFTELSYKPGERSNPLVMDSHDLRYVNSGDFCANLHIHTHHSDGILKVSELIEKTKKIPNMLSAVTDHDTLDGAQEAYKIADKDADIVLGVEISTVAIKFPKQPKPLSIHLLVYGVDPFDKELNEFLREKRQLKFELAKQTIKNLNDALPEYNFTLEEAAKCHPMILKGQDEIAHPMKKYTSCKIIYDHFCPNADFSYEKPFFEYKYMFQGKEPFHITYKKALENYLGTSLPLMPDEIFEKIQTAREIYTSAHPKIGRMLEPFSSFEETVKFVSSLKYGVMSIAHPARTKAYLSEFYNYLFYNFKTNGKEKAVGYEKYYQSYEGTYYQDWKDIIDSAAAGLIPTGGLDTHGDDIVYRGIHY